VWLLRRYQWGCQLCGRLLPPMTLLLPRMPLHPVPPTSRSQRLLVPPGGPGPLACAIRAVVTDPRLATRLREAALAQP
jgi:hypothetical protein